MPGFQPRPQHARKISRQIRYSLKLQKLNKPNELCIDLVSYCVEKASAAFTYAYVRTYGSLKHSGISTQLQRLGRLQVDTTKMS